MSSSRQTTCQYNGKNDGIAYSISPPQITGGGFHLIEVLLVCSLLVMLLSLALPKYSYYFCETRRSEARLILFKYAIALEHYYFRHNTFKGASADNLKLPENSLDKQYRIMITILSNDHYVLKAIPLGLQAKRDKGCRVLTLNQDGEKGVTGERLVEECWR